MRQERRTRLPASVARLCGSPPRLLRQARRPKALRNSRGSRAVPSSMRISREDAEPARSLLSRPRPPPKGQRSRPGRARPASAVTRLHPALTGLAPGLPAAPFPPAAKGRFPGRCVQGRALPSYPSFGRRPKPTRQYPCRPAVRPGRLPRRSSRHPQSPDCPALAGTAEASGHPHRRPAHAARHASGLRPIPPLFPPADRRREAGQRATFAPALPSFAEAGRAKTRHGAGKAAPA